jgi:hypothetical protein
MLSMKEMRWSASIRDISQGGVRLHVSRRFEKGTPLAIELPGNHERDPSVVFVKVLHVRAQEDGTWALGCKFISELGEDELQRLLTPPQPVVERATPPAPQEPEPEPPPSLGERNTPTITPIQETPQTQILSNVHFQIAIREGSQISCLIKRFNATKCWPLEPGKIFRLNGNGPDDTKWSLKIQVIQYLQESNSSKIQARLLRTPSLPELLHALGSGRA